MKMVKKMNENYKNYYYLLYRILLIIKLFFEFNIYIKP